MLTSFADFNTGNIDLHCKSFLFHLKTIFYYSKEKGSDWKSKPIYCLLYSYKVYKPSYMRENISIY